ncbi:hypothetical protein Zm00014a_004033 [Zea mays]|jgi:hypothetical protein|uniref:Uncharacterized protein n=2 Tax=Zea mays TaxID=4577 RepID=K7V1S8_MAIZE|nr:hypothetical protein ZEAMMB73_Zm00001d009736 [Zea mays]PWZ08606.1 hypothetical protein Zm00014a_004033 [Zea mays]
MVLGQGEPASRGARAGNSRPDECKEQGAGRPSAIGDGACASLRLEGESRPQGREHRGARGKTPWGSSTRGAVLQEKIQGGGGWRESGKLTAQRKTSATGNQRAAQSELGGRGAMDLRSREGTGREEKGKDEAKGLRSGQANDARRKRREREARGCASMEMAARRVSRGTPRWSLSRGKLHAWKIRLQRTATRRGKIKAQLE